MLVGFGVLVVLAGLVFAGRWWLFNQYYIGVNGSQKVAIFQGVQGSVLGMSMHRQLELSCPPGAAEGCTPIEVQDLKEAQRADVRDGITQVSDLDEARETIHRLRLSALLPICDDTEQNSDNNQGYTGNDGSGNDNTRNNGSGNDNGQQSPATDASARNDPADSSTGPSATNQNSQSSSEGTPLSSPEQEPGVNCRTVS